MDGGWQFTPMLRLQEVEWSLPWKSIVKDFEETTANFGIEGTYGRNTILEVEH